MITMFYSVNCGSVIVVFVCLRMHLCVLDHESYLMEVIYLHCFVKWYYVLVVEMFLFIYRKII